MSAVLLEIEIPPTIGLTCPCGAPGSVTYCREFVGTGIVSIQCVMCTDCAETGGEDLDSMPRDFSDRDAIYDSRA